MSAMPTAAVLTIGTELTTGLRQDTNGREVARALGEAGYDVRTIASLPDDEVAVEAALRTLMAAHALVVVTGGLGPTHDDITREAAARALGRGIHRDPALVARLTEAAKRHSLPGSREQMLRQADVIDGATVLSAVSGTAPGQVIVHDGSTLILLPGPPGEMRPLLAVAVGDRTRGIAPVRLRCADITESDAQHAVMPVIAGYNVDLTLLAAPGDIEVILFARGGDASDLAPASEAARVALGDSCYSTDGSSIAEVVLDLARHAGETIACAESCTGGLVAAALTDVPGASDVFRGGAVAYADEVKHTLVGIPEELVEQYGAVSAPTARAMAESVLRVTGASIAVATTGIAGPAGGSRDKPVGLVWFAVARRGGRTIATERRHGGDRDMIRRRATATALELLRREMKGL